MCVGFLLVILCSFFIFQNETNYVKEQASADVMLDAKVIDNCDPTGLSSGELIFSSCKVNAPDIATNLPSPLNSFVSKFEGASLSWAVEIYQWTESSSQECTKDNRGGDNCVTKYTYDKTWSDTPVESRGFHSPRYHSNTGDLPSNVQNGDYTVPGRNIFLSANEGDSQSIGNVPHFVLDKDLQSQFPHVDALAGTASLAGGSQKQWSGGRLEDSNLRHISGYLTTSFGSPAIGDIRISVSGQRASSASVSADTFGADGAGVNLGPHPPQKFDFWGRMTYPVEYLRGGNYDLHGFIAEIKDENMMIAWLFRLIGLVVMIAAFFLIFSPLSVMADLLMWLNYCTCCLGSILDKASQAVISAVSCGTGCICFTIIFCMAWCVANPTYTLLGVLLILCICGGGAAYRFFGMKENIKAREVSLEPHVCTPFVKLGEGKLNVVAVV
jgi:hypothetical protein